MKMHLTNILNQLGATDNQKKILTEQFKKEAVSHSAVVEALKELNKEL